MYVTAETCSSLWYLLRLIYRAVYCMEYGIMLYLIQQIAQ